MTSYRVKFHSIASSKDLGVYTGQTRHPKEREIAEDLTMIYWGKMSLPCEDTCTAQWYFGRRLVARRLTVSRLVFCTHQTTQRTPSQPTHTYTHTHTFTNESTSPACDFKVQWRNQHFGRRTYNHRFGVSYFQQHCKKHV